MLGYQTITDIFGDAELLRKRRFGRIEAVDGRFRSVQLRPFPCWASAPDIAILGRLRLRLTSGDRCVLYYNQPWGCPNYLVLKYVVSSRAGSFSSLRRVLEVLDQIARLKRSDALLCDISHSRISTDMAIWAGWEPHCPTRWHRHFIRRFYGHYPPRPAWAQTDGGAVKLGG